MIEFWLDPLRVVVCRAQQVGIWGMGGVGKTTLLQRINNYPSVEAAGFDYVIWIVASQDLSLDRLQKDIAKRVGLTLEATLTVELQALALHRYLAMKKFLLLLDDIWVPLDLAKLGLPRPATSGVVTPKCKVVFTTRSETICDQMTAYQRFPVRCKKIKIECLQPEEAWVLFLDSIGESMRSIISFDNRVCNRAAEIASKCGGLPLALVIIAQAMSGNKTWQEWEVSINSLNRIGIQEVWSSGADPFPLLKVSYDHLPNDTVKKCFLSCALWPEDHSIIEHDLIDCWLGMNLIDDSDDSVVGFCKGHAIIQCLRRACLLEEGDVLHTASVKMHDIIRGMALWIISNCKKKWMVVNRAKLKHGSEDATEWREAEAISLMYGRSGTLPHHPDCPNLLFLFLQRNSISVIPEAFFQNMRSLTCLDLSWNGIRELPPTIGFLAALRYLSLDRCFICSLPMELGNLTELKYLILSNTESLRCIPRGLISRLEKLEELGLNCSAFDGWDMEGQASIEELMRSRITSLSLDFRNLQIVEQLSENPFMSMRWLTIRDLEAVTTLPLQSLFRIGKTRRTLIEVLIWDCNSLEEIVISNACFKEFENIEQFGLRKLPALKRITFVGVMGGSLLRNIRFLSVQFCPQLKSATWILQFPHLESLFIRHCDKMEHVIDNEIGGDGGADEVSLEKNDYEVLMTFSNLMRLQLVGLPEICSFSTHIVAFPSLKYLCIVQCPKLDEDPFSHLKIHRKYE